MTWSTGEIEHEGFPLLLRRPDHLNIWEFKQKFSQLVGIQHLLEKVTSSGLPEFEYNNSLSDFDHYMCGLFEGTDNGIIFLIETFGNKRNYYFYTSSSFDFNLIIEKIKTEFNVKLQLTVKNDHEWSFLKQYPVKLFSE